MDSDPPPGFRWTGRQTEVKLIDPPCPQHSDEAVGRSWVPCRDADHGTLGRGSPGHNVWIYSCGRRLYRTGGDYAERLDCVNASG